MVWGGVRGEKRDFAGFRVLSGFLICFCLGIRERLRDRELDMGTGEVWEEESLLGIFFCPGGKTNHLWAKVSSKNSDMFFDDCVKMLHAQRTRQSRYGHTPSQCGHGLFSASHLSVRSIIAGVSV